MLNFSKVFLSDFSTSFSSVSYFSRILLKENIVKIIEVFRVPVFSSIWRDQNNISLWKEVFDCN